MACSHCTGPGAGAGTMDFYIMLFTVHTTPRPGRGRGQMGSIPILSTGSGTGKCSFNGFYIMPAALLIFFVVFKCRLLPVAMVRTCKIGTKCNKKCKERKLCRLFIIFLLWDMQQVYRDLWVHPLNKERSQNITHIMQIIGYLMTDSLNFIG